MLFNTKSNVICGFVNTVELKKYRTLVSGLAAESLSSDVLMGLYLVVFLAVQYVVGAILARLAFGRNRSPKKRSELLHRLSLASQTEKFKLRQRFIVGVRINLVSVQTCSPSKFSFSVCSPYKLEN